MYAPIKMNKNKIPKLLSRILPSIADPRILMQPNLDVNDFDKAVSAIKIDSIWKSTSKNRHAITDDLIVEYIKIFKFTPSILEVGSSTGSSSLSLIEKLGEKYTEYYLTDLFLAIPFRLIGSTAYFYHPISKECIMRVDDYTIIYRAGIQLLFPISWFTNRFLDQAPDYITTECEMLSLIQPEVKIKSETNRSIIVKEYSIFDRWENDAVDIIKICNILNYAYFSSKEILDAVKNMKSILKKGGYIFITDNRNVERVSVFQKDESENLILIQDINNGTDISGLVISA